ncbi:hypothetical protein ABK040_015054 [Willaertia magna]
MLKHSSPSKSRSLKKTSTENNNSSIIVPKIINVHDFVSQSILSGSDIHQTPKNERLAQRKKEMDRLMASTSLRDDGEVSTMLFDDIDNELADNHTTPKNSMIEKQTKLDSIKCLEDYESSSEDDDEDIYSINNQISLYSKLPPPKIQTLPFTFLTKSPKSKTSPLTNKDEENDEEKNKDEEEDNEMNSIIDQIQTREDFDKLKERTNNYIDNLLNVLDEMYNKHPNEYVVYYSFCNNDNSLRNNKAKKEAQFGKEQPTTIQFLKAMEKANDIMEEVDRSRRETLLKRKIASNHY